MNLKTLYGITLAFLLSNCNSNNTNKTPSSTPCSPEWVATGKSLTQIYINDSTEQMRLNDTLWFEAINKESFDSLSKCYLKMYRTNGKLESEGYAIYNDHPIADFKKIGDWIYYDCNGDTIQYQ